MSSPNTYALHCHSSGACGSVSGIEADLSFDPERGMQMIYRLLGDLSTVKLPDVQAGGIADHLWEHTCFELFIGVAGDAAYREFNFSPSGQWACYDFRAYRERVASATVSDAPRLKQNFGEASFELTVDLPFELIPGADSGFMYEIGITAVVEDMDACLSYWALSHPRAHPDFHDRKGFAQCLTFNSSKA